MQSSSAELSVVGVPASMDRSQEVIHHEVCLRGDAQVVGFQHRLLLQASTGEQNGCSTHKFQEGLETSVGL